ncbi:hypothetical protein TTHERM_01035680 (macronuclear) [Tetrahymena thermophila SB210]|uniref:Uncharacterized protein n=1 Tax=Tetrahymena thermophila (strain SB210) TaxID=312017 RepID=Q24I92_TETTS|nr:hypothetical protein TTHERM_01035680 [Tetrahymena thermophila SB210]EAS07505.2 hypothetical protein TTHERM_01035680 [Tetrahymena thermophila SB210]|eukprot:XP_001027747.2 hypothetical protein TTHERM_01035680 [Tetrahymena thermophila SB210]
MDLSKQSIKPFSIKNDKEKIMSILSKYVPQYNISNTEYHSAIDTIKSEIESNQSIVSNLQSNGIALSQYMTGGSTLSRDSIFSIKRSGFNFRNSKDRIIQIMEKNEKDSFQTMDMSHQFVNTLDQQQTISQKNKQFNFRQRKSQQ